MNRLLTLLILLCPFAAFAQLSGTVETSVTSAYTFRGQKIAGASLQPSVSLTAGNVSFTAWGSQPLHSAAGRELDLTLGIAPEVKGVEIDAGLTAYTYPISGGGRPTFEPYLGLTKSVFDFKVGAMGYRDLTLRTTSGELNLSRDFEASNRITVTPKAALGFVKARGESAYRYWSVGMEVAYRLFSTSLKEDEGTKGSVFLSIANTSTDLDGQGTQGGTNSVAAGLRVEF